MKKVYNLGPGPEIIPFFPCPNHSSIKIVIYKNNKLQTNETVFTPDRPQSNTLLLSTNVDKNSLQTDFLIAICHPSGDNRQLKTLSGDSVFLYC